MGGLGIGVGEGEVFAHHFEGGVTEEALEREDVAAVAEVLDGEGVAEFVGVGGGDVGAPGQAVEKAADGVAIHEGAVDGDEEGVFGEGFGGAGGEVFPEGG
mgnify:CR=1 FL=1